MNNTLLNGLRVLELLARSHESLGVTQIAQVLDLPKSNVHRLLQALVERRYVIRHASGIYGISVKLWELGSAALFGLDLRRNAEQVMDALMEKTGESVHLSVLDHKEVVYVHKVESPNPVRAYSQIGGRAAAQCVATGKAMIAFRAPQWLAEMERELFAKTPRSIVDIPRFRAEMASVRKRGYAVNRGEWRETVYGVAAPIRDRVGNIIAAVGVSGPESRFTAARIKELAEHVISAAGDLSESLSGGASFGLLHLANAWRH